MQQTARASSSTGWRGLLFNSGWLLVDRFGRMAIGLVVGVWIAHELGPTNYGMLNFALAYAALFVPLGSLGLERIAVRDMARRPEARGEIVGTAFTLKLTGALAGTLLALIGAQWTGGNVPRALLAVAVLANVFVAFDVIDFAWQAQERFDLGVKARGMALLLCTAGRIALIVAGASVIAFGSMVLVEAAAGAILLAIGARWTRMEFGWRRFEGTTARRLLADGWPVVATETAVMVFQRCDLLVLGWLVGEREVGVYSAAQKIMQVSFFIPPLAGKLIFPQLARTANPDEAAALVQRLMNGLVATGYVIAAFLWLCSGPVVHALFGAGFADAARPLRWLAACTIFVFMGSAHSLFLISRNRQAITLRLALLTAIVSVGLNVWLVPHYREIGAAAAALATYAITTTFGVALYRDSRLLLTMNLRALIWPARWLLSLVTGRVATPGR
jgi:PST family polysaccharide transporter